MGRGTFLFDLRGPRLTLSLKQSGRTVFILTYADMRQQCLDGSDRTGVTVGFRLMSESRQAVSISNFSVRPLAFGPPPDPSHDWARCAADQTSPDPMGARA
jgi:hypothetical protein